ETEYLFFRGMHGDKQPSGTRSVTITDSAGGTHTDHDAFSGITREVIVRNGPGGEAVSTTFTTPWKKGLASRTYSWGTLRSHLVKVESTETHIPLENGTRITRTVNSFDDRGFITQVDDLGDISTSEDDRCIRTTYAHNTD